MRMSKAGDSFIKKSSEDRYSVGSAGYAGYANAVSVGRPSALKQDAKYNANRT